MLTVALALLASALGEMGGLGRADQTLYDAAMEKLARPAPDDIVIVAIDEPSLERIGRWPWRRAIHATLIEKVAAAKPRAIGIDLILTEPDARDPQGDASLARALQTHPRIVLPVLMETRAGSVPAVLQPAPIFAAGAVHLGHVHVETDSDGVVRSLFLEEGNDKKKWLAFTLAMAGEELGTPDLPGVRSPGGIYANDAWSRDHWIHVSFSGRPGHIRQISYVKLLTGEVSADQLAGKYVLIGATAAGLGDAYPTPVTGLGRLMPGIELHAHALDSLLRHRTIVPAPGWAIAASSALSVIVVMFGFLLLSPRVALVLNIAIIFTVMAGSVGMLAWARLWIPPCAALLTLMLAYPLWGWRKLEATMRFLGEEFDLLRSEPSIVPESAGRRKKANASGASDSLERRIDAVRNAADSLRHARRFVADSLEQLPVAVLVTGFDERVLIANRLAAACFGADGPAALAGRSASELVASVARDGRDAWQEARAIAATATASTKVEVEFVTSGGASYVLRLGDCMDASGERIGHLATFSDITPIREAERKREETLAFLSHDLRSPQASILAAIDLHKLKPSAYPADAILPRIAEQARRTVDLAEQFVQLMRAESGVFRPADIDMAAVARDAVEEVQPQASAKNLRLRIESPQQVPFRADRALLTRALINLLNNAVKYSPENTEVTLAVSADAGRVRCAVRDQGYGISESDLGRLFERFARFSNPGQPKAQGIGLGLAFVKAAVERHGGRLEVRSTVGTGSEFAFTLESA